MWALALVIAGVFSPIAAIMAYVITHEEWSHHLLPRSEIVRKSLHMAAVTFVFFALFGLVVGAALGFVLNSQ